MSTDVHDLAAQIFAGFAIQAGPNEWDWSPLADKAMEAATIFVNRPPDQLPQDQPPQAAVQTDPTQSPGQTQAQITPPTIVQPQP